MQRIEWNDDLKLGISFIDEHHKQLILQANKLIDAVNSGREPGLFLTLLTQLREQAVSHFRTEEEILSSTRYERRSIHAMQNERLKVVMRRFQQQIKRTSSVTAKEVRILKKSLLNHIHHSNQAIDNTMTLQR